MANIKSQKKRILTNAKRAERNKAVKSELKTEVLRFVNDSKIGIIKRYTKSEVDED